MNNNTTNREPKILIINYYYYPNMIGGAEHSVKLLAEGLIKEGVVTAIYSYDGEGKQSPNNVNNVLVFRGKEERYKKRFISKLCRCCDTFWNSKHYDDLNNIIVQFNPDMVIVNNLFTMSISIWKFFSERKIPVIHTIRDSWLEFPRYFERNSQKVIYFPLILVWQCFVRRMSNKYVSYVVAPSQYMISKFISMKYFINAEQKVIPNSINLDINETRKIIAEKTLRTSSHIRYLYVGQLEIHKGILNLLDVWADLSDKDITLTICGKGPLKERIISSAKNDARIIYVGQLTNEELKKYYISSDVLIVPSIWEETFGRVIIEGNQYGLPVIGSNRGGIPEVLAETGGGVTFQYDSLPDLKRKIIQFNNRDEIKRYMNPILDNINKYQNINNIEQYIQIYNDIKENSQRNE